MDPPNQLATATGILVDTSVWASGYLADIGLAYASGSNYLTGGKDIGYYRFLMSHYGGLVGPLIRQASLIGPAKAHDKCYAAAGLDASVNTSSTATLTLQQAVAAQAC